MIDESFWERVDVIISKHNEHILTDEQRDIIAKAEQDAYEQNIPTIKEFLEGVEASLKCRGFYTQLKVEKETIGLRLNKQGYYGPGGFSGIYHVAGPLVLGIINPAGNNNAYYKNNLDENVQLGCNFQFESFKEAVAKVISDYLLPSNLIISKDQYESLRHYKVSD